MDKLDIFNKLTLKDKCKLFVGKNFWELEAINGKNIFLSDGPHGIRKEVFDENNHKEIVPAICYPAACLSACSFNKDLFNEYGQQLAKECIKNNIDVLLGPGINIKRNPLCGRNFEYFSEDPYLAGTLASFYINGVQDKHVGVSLKHFACNSQEEARFVNDSIVDERAMREIYLKGFEIAVKNAHPYTIMASYNKLNGIHTSENPWLLDTVCRKEWGFDGIFVSDWGAICHPVDSLKAGLDLEMPGLSKGSDLAIYKAIQDGSLNQKVLDDSTLRKIDLYLKVSQEKINDFNLDEALSVAKKINDESIVLLKNKDHILPINKDMSIALIGDFIKHPRIQGGGSSQINAINVTNLYDEFSHDNIKFDYAKGYDETKIKVDKKLIREACEISKGKDVVILMCGLPQIIESEGYDRDDMKMPLNQLKLIEEVVKVNPNVVILLQNGSPIEMPFINDVKGVLECYLGGSMHAKSIKDILFGVVNPSGRLAESFPLKYEDVYSHNEYLKRPYYSLYKESIYVGYRYYDTFNIPLLFPFGYGLSYADITYSDFIVRQQDDEFICKLKVHNNSNIPASEVIQIYVGQTFDMMYKPKKQLRAFDKVKLQPHEVKDVTLVIKKDDLRFYSTRWESWILEEGKYRFYLAKNVSDESNYVDLLIYSKDKKEDARNIYPVYYTMDHEISDAEFGWLMSTRFDFERKRKPYNLESTIKELSHNFFAWIIFGIVKLAIPFAVDKKDVKMVKRSLPYQPLRSLQMIASFDKQTIEGICDLFNGHLIKGIKKIKNKESL